MLFPLEKWNVYEATINCQHIVLTIFAESLNNRLTHLVGQVHPRVRKLISKMPMREELGVNRAKIAVQELGEGIPPPKRRKFGNTDERL